MRNEWKSGHRAIGMEKAGSCFACCLRQMNFNLKSCLHGGPLPAAVVEALEDAWALTEGSCPPFFSGYSGQSVLEGGAKL